MNKKILSMVIAGVLAATSLPVVSVSAAEVKASPLVSVKASAKSSHRFVGTAQAITSISVYERPEYGYVDEIDSFEKGDTFDVYTASNSRWYAVRTDNGRWGYIRKSTVKLI